MKRKDRLKDWATDLTEEQKIDVIVNMVDHAIDIEYVKFYDDSLVPYYDGDGEPIVEGQEPYEDED